MENYGIFLRKIIQIVAKGDTFIFNFQFSIINYLSGESLDKSEFERSFYEAAKGFICTVGGV